MTCACPAGGRLVGTTCVGADYNIGNFPKSGYYKWCCADNGGWDLCNDATNTDCPIGYDKVYGCDDKPSDPYYNPNTPDFGAHCTPGETYTVNCWAKCVWHGDYEAGCSCGN
jgi:hypothetical protein